MPIIEENEEKKKYLKGYIYCKRREKQLAQQIEELRDQKMFPSVNNDGMPHGSGISDLSSYVAQLDDLISQLEAEKDKAAQKYKSIYNQVQLLEDETEKEVLERRYLLGDKWWRIAIKMNYSESHIHRIHGLALLHFQVPANERT